jgi:hypothetical protein
LVLQDRGALDAGYLEGGVQRLSNAFLKDIEEAIGAYRGVFLESNGTAKDPLPTE